MGLFDKWRSRKDNEIVDPEDRSPQLGIKYKDLAVMGALMNAGADLSEPREVIHYLYFPTEEQAKAAANDMPMWETELLPFYAADKVRPWGVRATSRDEVLDPDFVRLSTDFFEAVAHAHDGEHDGWEASV